MKKPCDTAPNLLQEPTQNIKKSSDKLILAMHQKYKYRVPHRAGNE